MWRCVWAWISGEVIPQTLSGAGEGLPFGAGAAAAFLGFAAALGVVGLLAALGAFGVAGLVAVAFGFVIPSSLASHPSIRSRDPAECGRASQGRHEGAARSTGLVERSMVGPATVERSLSKIAADIHG
jgi:hypothetical protein